MQNFKTLFSKKSVCLGIEGFIVLVLAVLATTGFGYMSFTDERPSFFMKIVATALFIYFAKDTKYFRYVLFVCFFLAIVWMGTGVGFRYGRFNSLVMSALMGTDYLEATEFIQTISPLYPIIAISFLVLVIVLLQKFSQKPLVFSWGRCVLLLVLLLSSSFGAFSQRVFTHWRSFVHEKWVMENAITEMPDWQIQSAHARYQNYVIVIGESVSKDYMSLYGYPLQTTPFLDKADITYVMNYVTPSSYTYPSLSRMLSMNGEDAENLANHVVTLANAAKYQTYWLSNQGFLGKSDTKVAVIAARSKQTFFLKEAAYNSINIDDFALLPHLEAVLKESTDTPKVIFVHMMGSHQVACERLFNFPKHFSAKKGRDFDCYLATIEKMDAFLQAILTILQESHESYSLMYFSDHGVTIEPNNKSLVDNIELNIHHDNSYQQNFSVPLLWINSDQEHRQEIKGTLSGFDFIHLFASWLGISEERLKAQCEMEECAFNHDPKVFDGEKLKRYNELPALPIY